MNMSAWNITIWLKEPLTVIPIFIDQIGLCLPYFKLAKTISYMFLFLRFVLVNAVESIRRKSTSMC